jgi:hypothetical protein
VKTVLSYCFEVAGFTMADINFTELAKSAGTTTGDWLRDIGNAAADFACNLYDKYPAWIINHFDPTGISTAFGNGLMQNLCSPRPGYKPPATGGGGKLPPGTVGCWRVDFVNLQNVAGTSFVCANSYEVITSTTVGPPYVAARINGIDESPGTSCKSINVTYEPYVAGNPVPATQYGSCASCWTTTNPPGPGPATPPASVLNTYITVGGSSVPITFIDAHNNFGMRIDVGGIRIRIDHPGVYINDLSETNNSSSTQILNIVGRIESYATLSPKISNTLIAEHLGPSPEGEITGVPKIRVVMVELNQINNASSSRFGKAGGVYKAGIINFTQSEYLFPYEAIRYRYNIFVAPQGADGFVYEFYEGFGGYVTYYELP